MKTPLRSASARIWLVSALSVLGTATAVDAATVSWTGTSGNWSDSTWSGGVPPDAQDADVAITTASSTVDLVNTSRTVGYLLFGGAPSDTLASSGSGSLIFSTSTGNATLTMATVNAPNTISAPITLLSSLDVTVGASTSTRQLILGGKISGTGAITIKNSVGKLQINNVANDFSGGVTLETGGNLNVLGTGAYLGSGNFRINGGFIQTAAAGTVNVGGTQIWAGDFITATNAGSLNMGTSAVDLNGGTRTVTLSTNSNRTTTVGGVISNGGLAVSNSGTFRSSLILTGANTYAAGSTVNSGILATSTTGTFGTGDILVNTGAFLTGGNNASFGDLATLTFSSTSTASSISLNFTGTDTLGAVYDSISSTYLASGTYTASELNSYFSSSVFTGTGSLMVAAIPESSTCAAIFGALALGAVVIARRRRA